MQYEATPKNRRLNLLISEPLAEWAVRTADRRGVSLSELIREALEKELQRSQDDAIVRAAAALAPLYVVDDELTAFRALDGEPFA